MRAGLTLFALIVAVLAATWPASAQPADEVVTEPPAPPAAQRDATSMSGSWEFSNADRDKLCVATFRNDRAAIGQKIDFDRACAGLFPFIKEISGWTLNENDLLKLVDSKGKPVLEFSEVETGMFEAPRPGEGILFLQTMASAAPPPRAAGDMTGDWSVIRGTGKPICTLTLSNAAAGTDVYQLRVKPGCDAAVARFGATTWEMDRAELVLRSARNQIWRFEEGDSKKWQRVPETADGLVLLKQ